MSEELHISVTTEELQKQVHDASGGKLKAKLKSSGDVSVKASISHVDSHDEHTLTPDNLSGDTMTALFEGVEIVEAAPTQNADPPPAGATAPAAQTANDPTASSNRFISEDSLSPGFDQTDGGASPNVGTTFDEMRLRAIKPRKPGQLYFNSLNSGASAYSALLINNNFSRRAPVAPALSSPMARFVQKSELLFTPTKLRLSPRMRHRVAAFYNRQRKARLKSAAAQKVAPLDQYKKMREAARNLTATPATRGDILSLSPVLVDNSAIKTGLQQAEWNKHTVPRGSNYGALTNGSSALDTAPAPTMAIGKPLKKEDDPPEPTRDDTAIAERQLRDFRRIAASVNDLVPGGGGDDGDE